MSTYKKAIEAAVAAADKEIADYEAVTPGNYPERLYGPEAGLARDATTSALRAYRAALTVTTAEELDALPQGSAILDREGDVGQKLGEFWHFPETAPLRSAKVVRHGLATVLHIGATS